MKIKVIIPIGDVPEGEVVTMLTGTKEYAVRDSLVLYSVEGARQELEAAVGTRIMSCEGHSTAVHGDKEVVWQTTLDDLERIYADDR